MRRSIFFKLMVAFVLVAVISTFTIMIVLRATNLDRFNRFVIDQLTSDVQEGLTQYYAANSSWEGVQEYWQTARYTFMNPGGGPPPENREGEVRHPEDRRNFFALIDTDGFVVLAAEPDYALGMRVSEELIASGTSIQYEGQVIGTMLPLPRDPQLTPEETRFIERSNRAVLEATLIAVAIAVVLAVILSRTMARPLRQLTRAAQNMASGDLEQEVEVRSKDELGELAAAFNQMSLEVSRANKQRRQMTADIAHDLRTPLTVIAGYIESMRDGVLKPTPQRLSLIYNEIERLEALVNDLRLLSQVDAGELPIHPQSISPQTVLERAALPFQHRAEQNQISIQLHAPEDLPDLNLDEARMMQVLSNLIINAFQFTPAGGQITMSAELNNGAVCFSVSDTGQGIPPEELNLVFDRFYRVDSSRQDAGGGSGLGLAIVKALVEAQGGRVAVESVVGEGTTFRIVFPVSPRLLPNDDNRVANG